MVGLDNPERNAVATIPVTLQRSRSPQALVTERLQYSVVKALASVDVPYPDRNVSNHGLLPESATRPHGAEALRHKCGNSDQGVREILHRGHGQIRLVRRDAKGSPPPIDEGCSHSRGFSADAIEGVIGDE